MMRILAIVAVLAMLLGGGWFWERYDFMAPGLDARGGASETVVVIHEGARVWDISQTLAAAGAIENARLFELGVRLRSEAGLLKAGEYAIPSRASMDDVAAILIAGKSIEHKVTAAEGLTSQMIADLVNGDPDLAGEVQPVPQEGTLLPETYLFTRGTTRASILQQMRVAQERDLQHAWDTRAPSLPLSTPEQAIVLASIVEKESAIPPERRHIAAVFVNRLRLGMRLESDPTVIYGISKGYPLGRGIRESELQTPTPYNTYAIAGLPPTPICNPGRDSIEAVLNPQTSRDLYFVADGTGGHVFAASKSEHDKNVARWRQIENAQARAHGRR
jgi:UPF0755 protein